jgi:hypothetical protein
VAPRPPYCWEGGVLPRCCCCSTIPYWPARYWLEARLPTKFFKFKMVKEESSGTRNLPLPIDLWGNFSTYALDTNKKNNGHINRSLYKKLYFFRMHAHKGSKSWKKTSVPSFLVGLTDWLICCINWDQTPTDQFISRYKKLRYGTLSDDW